jgi:hypothetical protein
MVLESMVVRQNISASLFSLRAAYRPRLNLYKS